MTDTAAYRAAVRLLAASDKTTAELCERLTAKGFDEKDADAAVKRLTSEGYLNELSFAEKTVRRLYGIYYGKEYIRAYLQKRKFSDPALDHAETVMEGLDFESSARQYYAELKKAGKTAEQSFSSLYRRGFCDIFLD